MFPWLSPPSRIWLALPSRIAAPATPAPQPSPTPHCAHSSELCQWIFDQTGNALLSSGSYYLLVKPGQILLIVIVAVIARYLIHRAINRLTRGTVRGDVPAILRPLRDHRAERAAPERRRQRAAAIGSVLRSFTTASISSIAALLVLNELGFDLAPLLASAGIVGIALGFGAQTLVKDLLSGLFMLVEDQYGVGDSVDVGTTSGIVVGVGLRITTIRDQRGVLWYIRNGEITRLGNKSQGWTTVMVDIPVGFADADRAEAVMRESVTGLARDERWRGDLVEPPEVLGAEDLGPDRVVLRASVRVHPEAGDRMARDLRRRLSAALVGAGLAGAAAAATPATAGPARANPLDGDTAAGPARANAPDDAVPDPDPPAGTGDPAPAGLSGFGASSQGTAGPAPAGSGPGDRGDQQDGGTAG